MNDRNIDSQSEFIDSGQQQLELTLIIIIVIVSSAGIYPMLQESVVFPDQRLVKREKIMAIVVDAGSDWVEQKSLFTQPSLRERKCYKAGNDGARGGRG